MARNDEPRTVLPIPDPSEITTKHLDRAVGWLEEKLTVRIDGIEQAFKTQHADIVRVPTLLDRAIGDLRDFMMCHVQRLTETREERSLMIAERFNRVDTMFIEGDKRTQQLSTANALALAAALQAAKEAVAEQNRSSALAIAKSESAVGEQLKQLQVNFQAANQATNEKIDDLKSRLDRGEGGQTGERAGRSEHRLDMSSLVALIMLVVAVVAIFIKIPH